MKTSNNRTRSRRMGFHHLFLCLLCGASLLLAACGGGGGGGGGGSSGSGGGGTPAGAKLYYGYYVEDPANNPEDPTTGGLFIRVPTGDAGFAGQMPFSFIGCTTGTDIGAVSGNRVADTLNGNWSGTMDGTAVGGSFSGAYTAASDSYAGTYTNAAGKIQISIGGCSYYVAANGTFKLFGTPTSEPANFQAAVTAGTTPTISWPSLGASVTYAVRVFDEDCLNSNLSDPACFQGETFTTTLSVAYPTAFAGSSVLTAGKNYFVLVTAQDSTNGSFLGFSMLRVQPAASGGGGGGAGSGGGALTVTGAPASVGGSFDANSQYTAVSVLGNIAAVAWAETSSGVGHAEGVTVVFNITTNQISQVIFSMADSTVGTAWSCVGSVVPSLTTCSGATVNRSTGTLTLANTVLGGSVNTTSPITLNGTLNFTPF